MNRRSFLRFLGLVPLLGLPTTVQERGGPVLTGPPYLVRTVGPEIWTTIVVQSPMNNFRQDLEYATILASMI